MEDIPTQMILHAQPGLLGASFFAQRMHNERSGVFQ
jgi:glucokinase